MFAAENREQLEKSFKEFATRPQNKPLLEQHQQDEVQAALELREQLQELNLQQEVQNLDPADQKLLGPVLRSPVLRQLLVSMCNQQQQEGAAQAASSAPAEASGLTQWLTNPRVLQLLREAAKALKRGRITEEQLTQLLQQQIRKAQAAQGLDQPTAAPHQVQLPSLRLVEALNEHLEERRAGNTAYQRQCFKEAMHHYERALAIVNFVVGSSQHDQAEVEANKAAVLLNMAAVHMAQQEHGAAVQRCDEALRLAHCGGDAVAKAWLRRARANLGQHEYEAALQDLDRAADADPWREDVPMLKAKVLAEQRTASNTLDKALAAKMLGQC